ncbi:MAG: AMP-binding protein [Thermodesulfobacteriota bacterium]
MGLYDFTVQDMIKRNAFLLRDKVAVVCGLEHQTFGQYASEAQALAAGLAKLGVGKGERIAVVAFNCHEFFLLYGAAAFLGAVMLPINWRLKPEEIQVILEDCTPKVVVVSPEYAEMVGQLADRCPFVSHRLVISGIANGYRSLSEVVAPAEDLPEADVSTDDPFMIIHTAAVEGKPRGAVLTHGNLMAANLQAMAVQGIREDAVHLCALPLFHIAGLGQAMQVMHAGGKNVILRKFDAQEAVDWIEKEKVTTIGTFPPMLSMIMEQAEKSGQRLSSLRDVGGLDHPDTMQRFQKMTGARFWIGFGQSETSGFCTICPMDERPGSAGKAGPLVRVRLVDDYDREVPVGQVGEITVRGPLVFKGYWGLEKETAYTFRGGWHHTGDVGRFDEQGYLWYVKRKAEKELIKPGGENVYPAEVEKALLEHPEVTEACVFGVPDRQWGEAIKAVCVRKAGSKLEPEQLIDFVASRIARYKKPKHVVFVEAIPKAQDGGVDREKVKAEHGGKL